MHLMHDMHNEAATAIVHLAAATVLDCSTVSALTSMNSQLTEALATAEAKLNSAMADIQALKTRLGDVESKTKPSKTTSRNNRNKTQVFFNTNYYWSHGYHCHNNHTSQNCCFPKEGHQKKNKR